MPIDLRRFARGLVQLRDLADRYADDELSPTDVEQTGDSPLSETAPNTEPDATLADEPAPEEWTESTDGTDRD